MAEGWRGEEAEVSVGRRRQRRIKRECRNEDGVRCKEKMAGGIRCGGGRRGAAEVISFR